MIDLFSRSLGSEQDKAAGHSRAQSRAHTPAPTPAPDGATPKAHVSGALKFVVGEEQRVQALAAAEVWKKKFAEEAKWKNVIGRIHRFAEEDHLREHHVVQRREIPSGEQWLTEGYDDQQRENENDAAGENSINTDNPVPPLPRGVLTMNVKEKEKWTGPTCLSPPLRSPFSPGGFWESLSPTATTPVASGHGTPITAVRRPSTPQPPTPPADPDARKAYDALIDDIERMSLRLCARRLGHNSGFSAKGDGKVGLKSTMVRAEEEVQAAEVVLKSRQLRLKDFIDAELPSKLDALAEEGATNVRMNCIPNAELLEYGVETWLLINEETLELRTMLDEQHETMELHKKRRKSTELKITAAMQELIWATLILCDKEAELERRGDHSDGSPNSDDGSGYEYGNFMRDLTLQTNSSELERMVGELVRGAARAATGRSRSTTTTTTTTTTNTTTTTTEDRSRGNSISIHGSAPPSQPRSRAGSTLPKHPSTSPTKLEHSLTTLLRERDRNTPSPIPTLLRRSNAKSSSRARGLKISTSNISNLSLASSSSASVPNSTTVSPPSLSPEEKGLRRQGPSFTALKTWAEELRGMEERAVKGGSSGSRYSDDGEEEEEEGGVEGGEGDRDETSSIQRTPTPTLTLAVSLNPPLPSVLNNTSTPSRSSSQYSTPQRGQSPASLSKTVRTALHKRNKSSLSAMKLPGEDGDADVRRGRGRAGVTEGGREGDTKVEEERKEEVDGGGIGGDDDWTAELQKMEDRETARRSVERESYERVVRSGSRGGG